MRALSRAELSVRGDPIALFTLAGFGVPPAVPVPQFAWLRDGPELVVPPPAGPAVDEPDVARNVADVLAAALGGPFTEVAGHVTVVAGLSSPQQRAAYGLDGDPDRYGFVAVALDDGSGDQPSWWVQCLVTSDGQALVSLISPLSEAAAVGPGGHPVRRPLGDPRPLLERLAPRLDLPEDHSGDHDRALFDAVYTGPEARARCGVRRRTGLEGVPERLPYAYVLRVDLPRPTT